MKVKLAKLLDLKSIVAIILVLVYAYIVIVGMPVEETLKNIMLIIIGYLFGSSMK